MKTRIAIGMACIGVAAALALSPDIARSETVGAAAAVRPSSTGTPPGGETRTLEIGTDIVSRERIRTTGGGSLQVMFLDKTTLTIGPNSDLVIDDFVYNPDASTGSFAARLTKGALRFVGGQISHTAGAKITTPVATLVIRGGAAFVSHDALCLAKKSARAAKTNCTRIVCTGGDCTVTPTNARSLQLRINQAVEIGALGVTPFDVTSVTLNDVSKGGSGSIVVGKSAGVAAKFSGQSAIDKTIAEQSPEPPPPSPP